jgi:hypothetical protein
MKEEEEILAQLTDEDIARVDTLAKERGIPREEMFRAVVIRGLGVEEQRIAVKESVEKGGA